VRIQEYRSSQQEAVMALTDRIFGEGFFEGPGDAWRDPDTLALVATEGDDVVGFTSGRLLPEHGLRDFLDGQITDIPADISEADAKGNLGVIETVAVSPEHRGSGIGTKLLRVLHDHIVGYGADKLIITFRRGPSSSKVKELMERLGYEFWTSMESYWHERCDRGEFKCVDRTDACNCRAEIYLNKVY
jgi:ribosomal protein S18 acetylase RimI-like enzyme